MSEVIHKKNTKITSFFVGLLFLLVFIFPQSFSIIKLPILGFIMISISLNMLLGRLKVYSFNAIKYYYFILLLSLVWILIGVVNGNNVTALYDAFRLFVIYNIIYFCLIIYITNHDFYKNILSVILAASAFIAFIAFYTLIDSAYNLDLIPLTIRNEMHLSAGFHSGYTQLNNVNIGMYAFLIPFMFSYIILQENRKQYVVYFVLVLSVAALILASRRAIIFLIALVPFLCLIFDLFVNAKLNVNIFSKVVKTYMFIVSAAFLMFVVYSDLINLAGFYERIADIFIYDENSARQAQFRSLIDGFYENPIFGSGFGGQASIIRDSVRPWNYELTYLKLLFNAGIVGTLLLVCLLSFYTIKSLRLCRIDKKNYSINVSLIIGFLCVVIASASNPYINSFDFIFILAIPPLIISMIAKYKFELNK